MKKIIVGISGASGAIVGYRLLEVLNSYKDIEVHLVMSDGAVETLKYETNLEVSDFNKLADFTYDIKDIGASIASGSFRVDGMIVVPCSMKTVGGIYSGYSDNLLLRACDVMIKQRKKLVLGVRETPLSPIHLRNMTYLSEIGVSIIPLVMTFYNNPKSIDDMINQLIGKFLDEFDIDFKEYKRWENDDI